MELAQDSKAVASNIIVDKLGAPKTSPLPKYTSTSNDVQHLKECLKHIRAEYWATFTNMVPASPTPGWRKHLQAYKATGYRGGESRSSMITASKYCEVITDMVHINGNEARLSDLLGHLCIYRENLFYSNSCKLKCGCDSDMICTEQGSCRVHPWGTWVLEMCHLATMEQYPDTETMDAIFNNDKTKNKKSKSEYSHDILYDLDYFGDLFKAYHLLSSQVKKEAENVPLIRQLLHPDRCRHIEDDWLNTDVTEVDECWRTLSAAEDHEGLLNDVADVTLCEEQQYAVDGLKYPVEFISGPPGTGKSATICSVIRNRVLRESLGDGCAKTLIVTAQNKAMDVLVNRLAKFTSNNFETSEVGMFVVGSAMNQNMGTEALKYTMDSLLEKNVIRKEALNACKDASDDATLKAALNRATNDAKNTILKSARIVFTTFTGLTSLVSLGIASDITNVIVDEASVVAEWQAALLLCLEHAKGVLFVGDTKQLPPFTNIKCKKIDGYMHRAECCLQKIKVAVPMLTRQFRMHPNIASLISDVYYTSKLVSNQIEYVEMGLKFWDLNWVKYSDKLPTHQYKERKNKHGVKVGGIEKSRRHRGVNGPVTLNHEEQVGYSYVNPTEANLIIEGLTLFAQKGVFKTKSVFVICFYKKQVELILAELEKLDDRTINQALDNASLHIQTVDASQGSEADIVILSVVRSNTENEVGFLNKSSGPNRTCVALSRARDALIIVGNGNTMRQCNRQLSMDQIQCERPGAMVKSNFHELYCARILRSSDSPERVDHYDYDDLDGDFM